MSASPEQTANLSADDIRRNLQGEYTLVWAKPEDPTMAKMAKGCIWTVSGGGKACGVGGCVCETRNRTTAAPFTNDGWHIYERTGYEWGEFAPYPNRESHEFGGWNNASKYSFNFETGMWIDDQGVKFKNGLRAE